jgi:peptidoglycan/LPS O-acetylase OafA/YrhL
VRFAVLAGLVIAAAAPILTNLPWAGTPALLQEYLVPGPGRPRFPFFPCASYVGFGLAAGAIVKRTAADRLDRLMQWSALIGFALTFTAQYFSNIPYSIYPRSDFWRDSPALILIRVGIMLMMMAGAYLWTEFGMGTTWSWMLCFGKTSLMVYWVHVMLVYGDLAKPLKRALTIPQTALATLLVMLLMVALAAAWLWWKARRDHIRAANVRERS